MTTTTTERKPPRPAPLSVRLPRALERELRARARREGRPVNACVRSALLRYLREPAA